MPRTDNPVSVATTTEAPAVDNGQAPVPPVTSNTTPATAKTDATVDSLLPAKVGQSGESEEVVRTNRWIDEVPFLSVFAVALLSLFALPIAWVNDPSHKWLTDHTPWIVAGYGLLSAVVIVAVLAWWSKGRDAAVRAAALILVGFPTILIALGYVLIQLTPEWQINAVRTVVDVVLFLTPAVMWWLFLNARRASLLNEFLANLQGLGLLEARQSLGETKSARATRIDSYLQKFEGTYGRVPANIHDDLVGLHLRPYSREETGAQAPVSVTAVPVLIAVLVMAIGWFVTLPPVDGSATRDQLKWEHALDLNPTPMTFAFLGAYFFSIQMLFRRYVRSDLRGSAYIAVVMRIVLALIGIWVLQGITHAPSWQLLVLGFAVGVFPIVVWQIIRSMMIKIFKYALPSLESQQPLGGLDGLTVWHESRLAEEDIENIPNMATADVVGLLVSTRFPADRIVDWVDQAILLTYLGPDQASNSDCHNAHQKLAGHGIRTASALLSTAQSMRTRGEFDAFAAMIEDESGRPAVASLLSSIRTNSNLALVLRWRGIKDEVTPEDHAE